MTLLSIHLDYNPYCNYITGVQIKRSDKIWSSLHRRAGTHRGCLLCQTVLSSIVRFVRGAYVYVMITNWFQLV